MIKGVITCNLYKRLDKPSVNANNNGYYISGDEVEIIDVVIGDTANDFYEGTPTWYKLSNGVYVWSGGVSLDTASAIFQKKLRLDKETRDLEKPVFFINYNSFFSKIPEEIRKSKGKGVTVAVFDTGIYEEHKDFNHCFSNPVIPSQNFTKSIHGYNDIKGHGTHVAGLIGARSDTSHGIVGVAPEVNIVNIKVLKDSGRVDINALRNGIEFILERDVDIVNMSLDIIYDDYLKLEELFNELGKEKTVIAAAGRNDKLLKGNRKYLFFPAMNENIISVGSIDDQFINQKKSPEFNKMLDFIVPEKSLKSCFTKVKVYDFQKGSSMSTALFSGITALFTQGLGSKNEIINEIRNASYDYSTYLERISNKIDIIKV